MLAKADDVSDFSIGDRVITNGPHSEVVKVSKNLCAKVPDGVSDESAVFTVISSIAMQGIRLAKPNIGDNYAVIGVGLIGLLTIQLLKANGCNVLAIDFDDSRLELAKNYGADICNPNMSDPVNSAFSYSNNVGVDGVISVVANSLPKKFAGMVKSALEGDFVRAKELHYDLMPSTTMYFAEGNPGGVKISLEEQGLMSANMRLPLVPVSKELESAIRAETKRVLS